MERPLVRWLAAIVLSLLITLGVAALVGSVGTFELVVIFVAGAGIVLVPRRTARIQDHPEELAIAHAAGLGLLASRRVHAGLPAPS